MMIVKHEEKLIMMTVKHEEKLIKNDDCKTREVNYE